MERPTSTSSRPLDLDRSDRDSEERQRTFGTSGTSLAAVAALAAAKPQARSPVEALPEVRDPILARLENEARNEAIRDGPERRAREQPARRARAQDAARERAFVRDAAADPLANARTDDARERIPLQPASGEERLPPERRPMAEVQGLEGVRAGTLQVGAREVEIDPQRESLQEVLDRVAESDPDVSAAYLPADGIVRIETRDSEGLRLGDGTSGFFSAIGVEVDPASGAGGSQNEGFRDGSDMRRELREFARSLSNLDREARNSEDPADREAAGRLGDAVERRGGLQRLGLSSRRGSSGSLEFSVGGRRLDRTLEYRARDVVEALFGSGEGGGFVDEALQAFGRDGLSPGARVDVVA